MFPLAGTNYPASPDELASSIREALSELFTFPDPKSAVTVEGGAWPAIDRLTVNLNGAVVRVSQPPARPVPQGAREPGISIGRLEVTGHPIRLEQSQLDLQLDARDVKADFARDSEGKPMLVLADASAGRVQVSAGKADLQDAIRAVATAAARPHGVAIQDLQLNLTSSGPRSLAGDLRVKAKKMVMSGVVLVRGRMDVDDAMVATFSNLACSGEGMIGGMAAAMVNTKVRTFEGKRVPLMAFSLGDVSLRDLQISADDPVAVSAEFGRKS